MDFILQCRRFGDDYPFTTWCLIVGVVPNGLELTVLMIPSVVRTAFSMVFSFHVAIATQIDSMRNSGHHSDYDNRCIPELPPVQIPVRWGLVIGRDTHTHRSIFSILHNTPACPHMYRFGLTTILEQNQHQSER